jgi:hypothetical protein
MSVSNAAKVLRVAVIVDGESCEELRQAQRGDVSIIRGAQTTLAVGPNFAVETGIAAEGTAREQLLAKILLAVGLLLLIVGSIWFAVEVDQYVDSNAVLTKVEHRAQQTDPSSTIAMVLALLGVVSLMTGRTMLRGHRQRRTQQVTVYDGWSRPHDYRKRAPMWLGLGMLVSVAGAGLFAFEVNRQAPPNDSTGMQRGDMQVFAPSERDPGTGGLGLLILLIGIVPAVVGFMGLQEQSIAPCKREPKGGHAPRQHRLFEWVESEGAYYIDIPPETRGEIVLGSNKATVEQLRKHFGQGDRLRVKLGNEAKGKLLIGQTKLLFQTTKPVAEPAKPPFPSEYIDPLAHFRLTRLDTVAIGSSAAAAVMMLLWFGYFAERTPPKPDERFVEAMGLPVSYHREAVIDEVVAEEADPLEKKDVRKKKAAKKKDQEPERVERRDRPHNISDAALSEGRSVGVARTLVTYAGDGHGSVLDRIQSHENNLGELFDQGMSTTEEPRGGEIGEFVAGGGGIDSTGTMTRNEGMRTGQGPAALGRIEKQEREVRASTTTNEVIGDVDTKAVTATIRRRMSGLEACYERALRSNSSLRGKMIFTITINPAGRVTEVVIEEDTVADASVRSCTEVKIMGWRFVSDGAQESSEVTFTVSFTG